MEEIVYDVLFDDDVMAENMNLQTAMMLIRALADASYKNLKNGAKLTLQLHQN